PEIEGEVAAEPQPREEQDEQRHPQRRLPAVALLLLVQVRRDRSHACGFLPIERSTFTTSRSLSSVISQSSAGVAFAMPATMFVGTCDCFVLYAVAMSL